MQRFCFKWFLLSFMGQSKWAAHWNKTGGVWGPAPDSWLTEKGDNRQV